MKKGSTGKGVAKKAAKKSGTSGKARKFDPAAVRERLARMVSNRASKMLNKAMSDAENKSNVPAVKYMLEMAGIFPAGTLPVEQEEAEPLAKTLLQALGLPTDPDLGDDITKDCEPEPVEAGRDTVE